LRALRGRKRSGDLQRNLPSTSASGNCSFTFCTACSTVSPWKRPSPSSRFQNLSFSMNAAPLASSANRCSALPSRSAAASASAACCR
jgi:hypothetical protein